MDPKTEIIDSTQAGEKKSVGSVATGTAKGTWASIKDTLMFWKQKKPLADAPQTIDPSATNLASQATEAADLIKAGIAGIKKDTSSKATQDAEMLRAEKQFEEGILTLKGLIAPSAMEIEYNRLKLSGMYARSYYVHHYPRFLESGWLTPLINMDAAMDISQFVYPIESAGMLKYLRNKVAQLQAHISINTDKGNVRDPQLEASLEDAEELRDSLTRGIDKMFHMALYITVYSQDEKELDRLGKEIEGVLSGRLIFSSPAYLQMEHAFNSSIPVATDELGIVHNMTTGSMACSFPFISSDLTSNEGILYGINRHNDSLIIFDRFKLENANSVVLAKSGAGKSYAVKLEILRSLMMGTDVIVIDPENEYKELCDTVSGTYIPISLNSPERINPFDVPGGVEGIYEHQGDLVRSNIITLSGLLRLMLGGLTPIEDSLLDKALIDTYALKGITLTDENPARFEPPRMEDLYQILTHMEGASSLAARLEKYITGTFSGIFNQPTNVNLKNGLVVFSIRDLDDSLRPIAMYIILNYIWTQVRNTLKKRILVIDEAWNMLQFEDSARFLYGLVKRARKYYLGVSTITQDVEDFVKSPYGKPVVTNSSMQLLMKQSPAAIDILAHNFNLTEGEKAFLLNSGVGQGLFFAGQRHAAIQVIASYLEDKIVTTNPEEILKRQAELAQLHPTQTP